MDGRRPSTNLARATDGNGVRAEVTVAGGDGVIAMWAS
jgi:hypothetical protein